MKHISVLLLFVLSVVSMRAQTFFEPAAADVAVPTDMQRNIDKVTDVGLVLLPAAALTAVVVQQDWKGLIQGIEVAGATVAATYILKYAVKERRPDGADMHSFPSGHASISFASAGFLQRRYGWKFGAPAYAVATFVGWGRVYAKKHHIWDVVAGGAMGAGFAYLFTTPFARKHNLTISPVSDGHNMGIYASMNF